MKDIIVKAKLKRLLWSFINTTDTQWESRSSVNPILTCHVPLTNDDQIPGVHPWGLKRSFSKLNNVPTSRAQNIVKNVQFPACSWGFPGGQPPGKLMISALRLLIFGAWSVNSIFNVRARNSAIAVTVFI